MTPEGRDQGMWTFPDYSKDRLVLVTDLMARHSQDEGVGFIGAAVVVLHAAIEEWVTSYLTRDSHQYCQRYKKSFDTIWREWDPTRRTLHWKTERLGLLNTGDLWGIAPGSAAVAALQGLNQHRNRLVHMDRHILRLPLPGEDVSPAPKARQMYEIGRISTETVVQYKDGRKEAVHQQHVLIDPWRGMNQQVVESAVSAVAAMREQYHGAEGDDVGTLRFPPGPIWAPRIRRNG